MPASRLSPDDLADATEKARARNISIEEAALLDGRVDEIGYLELCSQNYGLTFSRDLRSMAFDERDGWSVDKELIQKIPLAWLRKHSVAPLRRDGQLILAINRPQDITFAQQLRLVCGELPSECVLAEKSAIDAIANKVYGEADAGGESVASMLEGETVLDVNEDAAEDLLEESGDAPFIRTVNAILAQALRAGASDIHIEPYRDISRVRFRLDGALYERHTLLKAHHAAVVSRVKVMAKLDIAEKRLPQDGRIAITLAGREAGLRVSTLPTSFGERVVLRLLEKSERILSLGELGLDQKDYELVSRLVSSPHGMILVTGPTGSGKTTTLYAVLREISSPDKNIRTIEDPVEYELEGVGQMQVNPKINLSFADGLRAIVRQDPDVILIGEIRDEETASIGVQSALTGHLVFSTLHTNDAPGAVTRLFDMGVEPFLLSSVLRGVVAQRLVRKLCPKCARKKPVDAAIARRLAVSGLEVGDYILEPGGCDYCLDTGYRGRMAIYELMPVGDELKKLVVARADSNEIRARALELGMRTLAMDGMRKVARGATSLEEVERVVRE
ncbi:MAG: Flp pilus assembly complex ATPase component TadA [Desulfovibrio sp.]|nr:Flp pilus assembly complex ATPase component TadA [Desulfovibrio sp.]